MPMQPIQLRESSLLVVDVQRGFTTLCPKELPIPGGLEIVPNVNRLLELKWARIDATQDWHPPDHRSFLGQTDNLYSPHCVAGTPGSEFLPGLKTERFHAIWRKCFDADFEAYSVAVQHPGFAAVLRGSGVRIVVICGLATNICCYSVAQDLNAEGFAVFIAEDASAGIDVPAAGLYEEKAKRAAQQAGISYVSTAEVLEAVR